jgi:hypothetical protein
VQDRESQELLGEQVSQAPMSLIAQVCSAAHARRRSVECWRHAVSIMARLWAQSRQRCLRARLTVPRKCTHVSAKGCEKLLNYPQMSLRKGEEWISVFR